MIPSSFFQYIYHVGCAFNLHSVINSGLILGGQHSSKRQTVFFLSVDLMDKSHKDLDFNVQRHAQYLPNAWKRHQHAVYWVDINLAIQKGLKKFYQTRTNAMILHETLPAFCFPKVVVLETGEFKNKKVFARNPKRSAQCVYHTGISVFSIARAGISCIKKEGPINNSSIRWTFFQSLSTSSRREDLMDIDMVKSRETNNIIWLTNCKKCKKIYKESMTDSYDIKNSVFE